MMDQGNQNVYEDEVKFEYGMINQMYVSSEIMDAIPPAGCEFAGLPISRKRSRDHDHSCQFDPSGLNFSSDQCVIQNELKNENGMFMFLGQDISMQIYQQQVEIDSFIAHHMEKVRSDIEATRSRNLMRLLATVEEGMKKRLRSKQDEITNLGRLNRALEEKLKSLNVENQIWQQMAQTNENTANVLRRNLQQILTQQQQYHNAGETKTAGATADDAESCTGSNYDDNYHRRQQPQRTLAKVNTLNDGDYMKKWCRNCGKEELGVLVLPCRHLCICTVCESSINICPICNSIKNSTLHVNMNIF